LTGATVISEETGLKLENAKLADLGRAHRIEIDKDNTTLIGSAGASEQIKARLRRSTRRSKKLPATTTASSSKNAPQDLRAVSR